MALKQMIKFTKNVAKIASEISNYADMDLYTNFRQRVVSAVVGRLQYGIDSSITIEGGRITGIKDSTRMRRIQKRQDPDNPPLKGSGGLYNDFAMILKGRTAVELSETPKYEEYGRFHNEGFDQTNSKQWHYGATVPKRKYWGIPKTWRSPGGTAYKRAMNDLALDLRHYTEGGLLGTLQTRSSSGKAREWFEDSKREGEPNWRS